MIKDVPLSNKPICMITHNSNIYIGDARGRVLKLTYPFLVPKQIAEAPGPVSTIFFADDTLNYGTWDGILYREHKEVKLGTTPIKCGCFYKEKVFISIDSTLISLNLNLKLLEKIQTESKIFAMDIRNDGIDLAMANGSICRYEDKFEKGKKSTHEMSILCIKNGLSGSTDCTVVKDNAVIFQGSGWVRSIWSEDLFSSGCNVIEYNKTIYSHKDEVISVVMVENTIVSIGLDYCYKVYQKEVTLTVEEEAELLAML